MSDRELKEAVEGFFRRHPDLALDRFGLPAERLTWLVPFRAVDSIAMLLCRWPRREQDWHGISYFFRQPDGVSLTTDPDRIIIPSSSIERELSRTLWESPWESYVPVHPGKTKDVLPEWMEFRRKWGGRHVDMIARHLIKWALAAAKTVPSLMYGYRAYATGDADRLRFEPFAKGEPFENARKVDAWKL